MSKSLTLVLSSIALFVIPSLVIARGHFCSRTTYEAFQVLDLYVGYVSNGGSTDFFLSAEGNGIGGDAERSYECTPMSTLYVGSDLKMDLGNLVTARFSGRLTVPVEYDFRSDNFDPASMLIGGRSFTGSTTWGTAEGVLNYSVGSFGAALIGFRWDNWQTTFKKPKNVSPGFVGSSKTDSGVIAINCYMPFAGLLTSYDGFSLGVMGTPWFPGDFEFVESRNGSGNIRYDRARGCFNRGTFVEIFSDYNVTAQGTGEGDVSLSLFSKVNFLEVYSNVTLTRKGNFLSSDLFNCKFRRIMYIIGGKITVNFTLSNI